MGLPNGVGGDECSVWQRSRWAAGDGHDGRDVLDRRPDPARAVADVEREWNELLIGRPVWREERAVGLACNMRDDDDVELARAVGVRRRESERVRRIRREALDRVVAKPHG